MEASPEDTGTERRRTPKAAACSASAPVFQIRPQWAENGFHPGVVVRQRHMDGGVLRQKRLSVEFAGCIADAVRNGDNVGDITGRGLERQQVVHEIPHLLRFARGGESQAHVVIVPPVNVAPVMLPTSRRQIGMPHMPSRRMLELGHDALDMVVRHGKRACVHVSLHLNKEPLAKPCHTVP